MALINCPECGKEISDKAVSCPSCGLPVNKKESENEEYMCCPKCLSKDLHVEQKGFSGGKALAGAVVTGGIGLLAGTIGSKDVQITCLKCGAKFKAGDARLFRKKLSDEKIDPEIKALIESGNILAATALYNKKTGAGIAESKRYVDSLRNKGNTAAFNTSNNSGCAGVILLLVISMLILTLL
jgi:endogenous inhibitor of DNA gyrase (YacG/DUF329 family)